MAINLLALLESTGLPVTYTAWGKNKAPDLPYIVYQATDSENFAADDVVYHPFTSFQIELYSDLKDLASEALIEAALNGAGIYYDKLESYIESEDFYQVTYLVQI